MQSAAVAHLCCLSCMAAVSVVMMGGTSATPGSCTWALQLPDGHRSTLLLHHHPVVMMLLYLEHVVKGTWISIEGGTHEPLVSCSTFVCIPESCPPGNASSCDGLHRVLFHRVTLYATETALVNSIQSLPAGTRGHVPDLPGRGFNNDNRMQFGFRLVCCSHAAETVVEHLPDLHGRAVCNCP